MVRTIAKLTLATLFGHRRGVLLFLLPAVFAGLCVVLALTVDDKSGLQPAMLQQFGLAVILPLVALVAGTGVLATEIDDGSIVYLLSKPIRRSTIILTKASVAIGVIVVLGAVPIVLAGLALDPGEARTAFAFGLGAVVAGIAYAAIFVALSVLSGNAVTVGLLYCLLWESVMGQYVDGAKVLSVQQWSLAVVEKVAALPAIRPATELPISLVPLVAVTVVGLALAIARLRTLTLSTAE